MSEMTLPGDPTVPIVVRRSARARRLSLRVSRLDGRVTLTLPRQISEGAARAFAFERADWVRRQLKSIEGEVRVGPGVCLPVEGQPKSVVFGVKAGPGEISARSAPALAAALKVRARDRLSGAVDHYSEQLGKTATRIVMRDTRSRWGSCSTAGRLMFSWRLILAPPEVLNYVAAHEVAHLKHMDHSSAFWTAVERLHPEYRAHRDWLRQNGPALHRYKFDH